MNEYLNRVGRPAQTVNRGPADAPVQPAATGGKKPKRNFNVSKVLFVVLSVLIAVVLIGLIFLIAKGGVSTASQIKTNQYQAVFLNSSDGQVYFGKLSVLNRDYYKLTDIYYVRVQQVQPDKNSTQTQQNISLAKLGNEIHGPEDVMYVNRNSVMFWENLKEDGQVVKAIREYQKNPNQGNTQNNNNSSNSTNK
ncbi:MAG: hypothetical protein U0491_01695 [Candidatus Saccharimonadales bacterium]